jgi:basic membrane protein A
MEELIKNGCEIIICNSYGFGEYELDMAMKYPDVTFFHTSGTKDADNLSTYFGRMYQIRYLCGIVAGLQTETNEIGYVAAYDLSEVNRGINAFTLGVRKVNPDANVYVRYCDSWDNDDATKKVAQELFDSHNIDVMTVHSDSLAAYDEAEKRGIYIIGYNRDDSEDYPDYYLTAAIWQWDKFYTPKIKEVLQDKFKKEQYWDGVESGIVELAPLTKNVKDGTERIVTSELFKLENGNFDVFYGPIYDTDGNLRVAEGESMTDEVMLNSFDWNVEGVVIDEK